MSDVIGSLNTLLEAERAGVEALVDLTRMSADIVEREMLQQMGGDAVWACASLRTQIEALGGMPSRRIAPLLAHLRARDYLAARLSLFVQHERAVVENLNTLLEGDQLPPGVHEVLEEMYHVHLPHIAWCEQRIATLGMREVPKEDTTADHVARGRIAGEGYDVPRRSRHQRSAGNENKRHETSRADSLRSPRVPGNEGSETDQVL